MVINFRYKFINVFRNLKEICKKRNISKEFECNIKIRDITLSECRFDKEKW
jgi:hypothetical protein